MDRRDFLSLGLPAMGIAMASVASTTHAMPDNMAAPRKSKKRTFKLNYAPHFGMFKHHAGPDPIDQLKFMADQGFRAMEDNGMRNKPRELQEKIRKEMERLDMRMGVFVAYGGFGKADFVSGDKSKREGILNDIRDSVEVAKRVNAKWVTVVPGNYNPRLEPDYQNAHAIETLRYCAEICEPSGLVMVLEPLNPWRDHPGLYLTKSVHDN